MPATSWRHWRGRGSGASLHAGVADTLDKNAWKAPHLTAAGRKEFLANCWSLTLKSADLNSELLPHQSYFNHYEESCSHLQASLRDCTHEEFCNIVHCLQNGTRQLCEVAIQKILPVTAQSSGTTGDCVNFVGLAILLLNLREWRMDETLAEFIIRVIASDSTQNDQSRLPLSFNARAFEQMAGIEIKWTRDLLSHLKIGPTFSSLTIFHHAKVYDLYEHCGLITIFPAGFLDETRRTLSLMLPVADKASVRWFDKKQRRLGLDPVAGDCQYLPGERRRIEQFNFWRDRLIVAKEIYDLSQPSSLLQFWRDDRNRVQWWTFWIAIIVFLLTLIGVIEGALQVYKAYYPST